MTGPSQGTQQKKGRFFVDIGANTAQTATTSDTKDTQISAQEEALPLSRSGSVVQQNVGLGLIEGQASVQSGEVKKGRFSVVGEKQPPVETTSSEAANGVDADKASVQSPGVSSSAQSSETKVKRFVIVEGNVPPAAQTQPTAQVATTTSSAAGVISQPEAMRRGRFEVTSQPNSAQTSPTEQADVLPSSPESNPEQQKQPAMKQISLPSTAQQQPSSHRASQPLAVPAHLLPSSDPTVLNQLSHVLNLAEQQRHAVFDLVSRLKGVLVQDGRVSIYQPSNQNAQDQLINFNVFFQNVMNENQQLKAENEALKNQLQQFKDEQQQR
jgi:hypothetical protein